MDVRPLYVDRIVLGMRKEERKRPERVHNPWNIDINMN